MPSSISWNLQVPPLHLHRHVLVHRHPEHRGCSERLAEAPSSAQVSGVRERPPERPPVSRSGICTPLLPGCAAWAPLSPGTLHPRPRCTQHSPLYSWTPKLAEISSMSHSLLWALRASEGGQVARREATSRLFSGHTEPLLCNPLFSHFYFSPGSQCLLFWLKWEKNHVMG